MCNQHQHWQYQARYGLHLTQQLLFLILMDMEMNELLTAIPCKLTCWISQNNSVLQFLFLSTLFKELPDKFPPLQLSLTKWRLFHMRHWLYSRVRFWHHLQQSSVPSARQTISTPHQRCRDNKKGSMLWASQVHSWLSLHYRILAQLKSVRRGLCVSITTAQGVSFNWWHNNTHNLQRILFYIIALYNIVKLYWFV